MRASSILIVAGAGMVAAGVAWGQAPTRTPRTSRAAEQNQAAPENPPTPVTAASDTIELASPIDLKRLVDLAAERSGVRIEYDPGVLSGSVTLRIGNRAISEHATKMGDGIGGEEGQPHQGSGKAALRADELWDVVNQLLAGRGFTVVQVPDRDSSRGESGQPEEKSGGIRQPLYRVVRLAEASAGARLEPGIGSEAVSKVSNTAGFASVLVRLKHVAARDALEAVKAVLTKQGSQVSPIGEGGLLLISDIAPRLQEALRIIEEIDVAGEPVTVETYETTGLDAGKLTTLVSQVIAKRDALAGGKKAAGAAGSPPGGAAQSSAPGSLGQELRGDVLTTPDNQAVLVIAPRSAHPAWRSLLATLDRREAVMTKTYMPRRFNLDEVAELIEQTIEHKNDERFKVFVNPLTSALAVTATESQQSEINELIQKLEEVPPPSAQPVRRIAVRNRSVSEVLPLLERLLQRRTPDQGPASPIV